MKTRHRSNLPRLAACTLAFGAIGMTASLVSQSGEETQTAGPAFDPLAAMCHPPGQARGPGAGGFGLFRPAFAQSEVSPMARQAASPAAMYVASDPPLWDGLGTTTYKVTTRSAEAQRYFDQGLRLAYAFNHLEAQRAFRKAQRLDPSCAMCFWGEGYVLGPNINMPMMPDAVAPAFAAAAKAKSLAANASAKERALIDALALRYARDPKADRAALDKAYAEAMGKAAAQYPDDDEFQTFYAEAVMDLSPWDYWMPGGAAPRAHSAPIVPTLERVLARSPDHAGAIHLYIHAVEASDRPERAERAADRLRGKVPRAGHLVHMPSHIFYRLGRYADAFADNKRAAAVDEAYIKETGAPPGVYSLGYYPHNVHFVLATGQMTGEGPTVIATAEKLKGLIPDEVAKGIALVQPIKAAPYFAHALFSPPATVLGLADPGDTIAYVKAMWHYARGIAYVRQGWQEAAKSEIDAIARLEKSGDFSVMKAAGVPVGDVLRLAIAVIEGRIAQAKGDHKAAADAFLEAAVLQDGLPYMEPPYWYYPVRQSLAVALMQSGRLAEAEAEFKKALRRAPASGWTYFGLAELYKAKGDTAARAEAEAALARVWTGDRALLTLGRL
jgi:tetratricopeptide (TPR) repeat protein